MGEQLDLSVDRETEVPVSTQLIWKLRTLIATGALPPGARLPGIREVADAAGVNVNTVRSVFARLEEQGLLASEHGRGTFVATGARADSTLAEAANAAITTALAAGIDPRALAAALYVSASQPREVDEPRSSAEQRSHEPSASETDARSERRTLYAEIARLERELAPLDPLGTLQPRRGKSAPRLQSSTELRAIRDDLRKRIERLRTERDEWRAAQRAAEELEQEERVGPRVRAPSWRNAGVWTGRPAVEVSWTAP